MDEARLIMELQNHKIINDTSHPFLIRTASKRKVLLLLLRMETTSSFLGLWFCLYKLNTVILSELLCDLFNYCGTSSVSSQVYLHNNFYYIKQICFLLMVYL